MGEKRVCVECAGHLNRRNKTGLCQTCHYKDRSKRVQFVGRVMEEEAKVAPAIPTIPKETGSAIVWFDPHVPWHDPAVIKHACEAALLLDIRKLIVPGDLIHADTISKYIGVGKTVPVTHELQSCGRVLRALEEVFDRIVIIPGNHDQRIERMIASLRETKDGRRGLEMVAALLEAGDMDDAEDLSLRYLRHFLGSPKVTWHELPQLILNDTWLLQHPGTVSRIAPQTERAMARKHRKSVVQGHSHIWGVGFDESATDVCFNGGHGASDEKWRYIREKPTTFPKSVKGYGVIYQTEGDPGGKLIPIALHDRMFSIQDIAAMLGRS